MTPATREENKAELSRLIKTELENSRRGPSEIVRALPPSLARSFYWWMDGTNAPRAKSRILLEEVLGWRVGVVTDILESDSSTSFTLSEVRDWSKMPEPVVTRASQLSDEELLMELTRRWADLRSRVEGI